MPGGNSLAKAQQAEADTFHNLEIKQDLATSLPEDQGRLISSVRTPQSYLSKLETAVTEYKTAVSAVLAASEEEEIKKSFKEKLTAQLSQLDPVLNQLHDTVDAFNTPTEEETPAQTDKTNRIISCIKLKIHGAEKSIGTKLQIVWDAEKEEDAFTSLSKIGTNLQILEDVLLLVRKDLNNISNQIVNNELTDTQAKELVDEVSGIIDTNTSETATPLARLL